MAKLSDKFSIAKPVVFDSNGHKVRPVDVNGSALDDPTQVYSVAHPVIETDSTGTVLADSTKVFSNHRKVKVDPTGTPVVTTNPDGTTLGGTIGGGGGGSPSSTVTYDTAIGNGVGTDGFTLLPLRTGAKLFYVNSSTGTDTGATSSTAQNPATPVATLAKALSFVTSGNGDQVLMAEGTSYVAGLPTVNTLGGFSAVYPTCIRSYDPADPTNSAKFGRATGNNRPVLNTGAGSQAFGQGTTGQAYFALQGLEWNPGNVHDEVIGIVAPASGTFDYYLWENCIFRYTSVSNNGSFNNAPRAKKWIFRLCAFYGQWSNSASIGAQGIFMSNIDGLTIEDSVFWHCGWKIGANRTDDPTLGGATQFDHPLYIQGDCINTVSRRNALINGSADGGILKGGGLHMYNLGLSNPIAFGIGGGNTYDIYEPTGMYVEGAFNVVIGGGQITTGGAQDWGMTTVNGKPGSVMHHNIIARSSAKANWTFMVNALTPVHTNATTAMALPAYCDFHDNVAYQWANSGSTEGFAVAGQTAPSNVSKVHGTVENNIWDDPTSGTNTNIGSVIFANAYTEAALLLALDPSYTTEDIAAQDWCNNVEKRGWQAALPLARTGYGITLPSLIDLNTDMSLTIGIPSSGMFIGTQDGSVLTASGLPTGVTLDSDCRCWRYDGTGSPASGTALITETSGTAHTTSISWNSYAQPVLSGLSATTTQISVSTTVGSGTLYWIESTASAPTWQFLKIGLNGDFSTPTAAGSQAVTATGAQTISASLTAGQNIYIFQFDANNNPSLVGSAVVASVWTPASLPGLAAWYEADSAHSFTDLGTTAVTTDGQSVEQINDKSGLGHNLTNTNSGQRPTWFSNSGKPYWSFNGTTDFLNSASGLALTDGSGQWWVAVAVSFTSTTAGQVPIAVDGTTAANNVGWLWNSGSGVITMRSYNSSGTVTSDNAGTVSAGTPVVLIGTVTTTAAEAFVDNVSNGSTALTGTRQSNTAAIYLGQSKSNSLPLGGNIYAVVIGTGTLSSTDRANLQAYLAALHQ